MSSDDLASITAIVKALDAKKATDIVVLDLRNQSSYLTYFVIATALSKTHLRTLFDEVHKTAVENGIERPRPQSPQYESGWVTYDFGFYVVHLFEEEKRKFYNLEGVWKNATPVPVLETSSINLTPRKGTSKSEVTPKKEAAKPKKTSKKSASLAKKKTTIKKKTTKEIKMATAKKKPAKKAAKKSAKKAAKKTAKKK